MSRKRLSAKMSPAEGAQRAWDSHLWKVAVIYMDKCPRNVYRCSRCGQTEQTFMPTIITSCRGIQKT